LTNDERGERGGAGEKERGGKKRKKEDV